MSSGPSTITGPGLDYIVDWTSGLTMLLVLTGQLTFGSLDDACKKEKYCTEHAIRLLTNMIIILKCYNVQYVRCGVTTTNTYQTTNLI